MPIVVQACWASAVIDGALGTGAPTGYRTNTSGTIFADTFYPIALANARAGVDLAPDAADMVLTFDGTIPWSYDVSASGNADFITVALHELGHGLGFVGNIDVTGGADVHLAAYSSTLIPPGTDR